MNNTSAVDVSNHAVSPELIGAASAAFATPQTPHSTIAASTPIARFIYLLSISVETDSSSEFSFENLCDYLQLNPGYVRKGLLKWKKEKRCSQAGQRLAS
jgi:hypothetical protein